jgi:hypothetical protein
VYQQPGHHAGRYGKAHASTQGFCLLNNVCIAAHHLRLQHALSRIAIFDFDVHHANGTEEIVGGVDGLLLLQVYADFDFIDASPSAPAFANVHSRLLKASNQSENLSVTMTKVDELCLCVVSAVLTECDDRNFCRCCENSNQSSYWCRLDLMRIVPTR